MTEQWYNNKELFEMIQELKTEIKLTTTEMARTREIVAKYNGLREQIEACKDKIEAIEHQAQGRYSFGKAIREWGGWLVAIASFLYAVLR
jgi:septal ring factor EnvC (AmiA/AmiB activator)